jgi:hypothetical protein
MPPFSAGLEGELAGRVVYATPRCLQCLFQPLSAYANKLVSQRKDGTLRVIRNPVQNEVGFWTDRNGVGHIVILKDQGPGDLGGKYHQVPSNIES